MCWLGLFVALISCCGKSKTVSKRKQRFIITCSKTLFKADVAGQSETIHDHSGGRDRDGGASKNTRFPLDAHHESQQSVSLCPFPKNSLLDARSAGKRIVSLSFSPPCLLPPFTLCLALFSPFHQLAMCTNIAHRSNHKRCGVSGQSTHHTKFAITTHRHLHVVKRCVLSTFVCRCAAHLPV